MRRHLAEYERAARNLEQLRARVTAAETALAGPLHELGKLVGREQAAVLAGVDRRVVDRAYKTARNGDASDS